MAAEARRLRISLKLQLLLVLLLLAAATLTYLQVSFGPSSRAAFLRNSSQLIATSNKSLQDAAQHDRQQSADLLKELISHTTASRRRHLQDLPLSIHQGDLEGLRQAILDMDRRRAARAQRNVEVLSREMQARSAQRIDGFVSFLENQQRALSREFAAGLEHDLVTLTTVLSLLLLLLLGLGLHLLVVRPIQRLRAVTRQVHDGNLDLQLPQAHSLLGAEVQLLRDDFAAMLGRLQQSQAEVAQKTAELEDYNQRLAAEVETQSRQLVHAAKMASLGTLSGGIAHEFNNLIGGIRGCAREAQADTEGPAREAIEVILRATDRAQGVTQKLLNFARQNVDRPRKTSLSALLLETLALVEPQLRRQQIEVTPNLEEDLEAEVDPGAMHQVFLNLISNAIQAMPEGGQLRIHAGSIPAEAAVEIRISDQGVGVAADDLERIFEPFYSTKDLRSGPNQGGTGLGLSVSYGLVEAHHGSLRAESQVGCGTTMILRLPCTQPA